MYAFECGYVGFGVFQVGSWLDSYPTRLWRLLVSPDILPGYG